VTVVRLSCGGRGCKGSFGGSFDSARSLLVFKEVGQVLPHTLLLFEGPIDIPNVENQYGVLWYSRAFSYSFCCR